MMQDDIQSVLISEQQLADAVKKLGEQISRDYADRNLMMVSVCLLYTSPSPRDRG